MLRRNYKVKPIIKKGDRFNKLVAVEFSYKERTEQYWLFKCDCGKEKVIRVCHVKSDRVKSCGCLSSGKIVHGMSKTRVYRIWSGIKTRCFNKNCKFYKDYGGRGITLCKEWMKFENFYEDMGDCPEKKSIDRIDNNGNYCKENCRWATDEEQHNNTSRNRFLTYDGRVQTVAQWARELKINRKILYGRIYRGWSIKDSFSIGSGNFKNLN